MNIEDLFRVQETVPQASPTEQLKTKVNTLFVKINQAYEQKDWAARDRAVIRLLALVRQPARCAQRKHETLKHKRIINLAYSACGAFGSLRVSAIRQYGDAFFTELRQHLAGIDLTQYKGLVEKIQKLVKLAQPPEMRAGVDKTCKRGAPKGKDRRVSRPQTKPEPATVTVMAQALDRAGIKAKSPVAKKSSAKPEDLPVAA